MTHHMKPLPLRGADLEASSSPPTAGGNAGTHYRAREAGSSAQARVAVSLAIALRYRAGRKRAFLLTPTAPSSDV
jgi:hypothetical protein